MRPLAVWYSSDQLSAGTARPRGLKLPDSGKLSSWAARRSQVFPDSGKTHPALEETRANNLSSIEEKLIQPPIVGEPPLVILSRSWPPLHRHRITAKILVYFSGTCPYGSTPRRLPSCKELGDFMGQQHQK